MITTGPMPKINAPRFSTQRRFALLLSIAAGLLACSGQKPADETAQTPTIAATPPVGRSNGGAIATEPEDGEWVRPAKTYSSTRFSGLNEITADNVKSLHLAWTFGTGILRGHEAAPLVVNNTMYIVTPFPNILYALDLTKPGAPMKWIYRPGPIAASQGVACCDVVNRGASYADGKIVYNTLDNHTVAVDANTGKELWKTKVGEINLGESMTMAPLIVKNHVFVGNSGGEFGIRGWLTALDLNSGKIVWRAYHTGPDSAVL
ncbi:MAG TPA: PQQ-binding-like beta-propeller repeat protein, partial [Gemmatimonadaceae bacterium]|nr:PQQ-binding-like beta-propeller repeat protein [Gemmatimonadaceae bacterium]